MNASTITRIVGATALAVEAFATLPTTARGFSAAGGVAAESIAYPIALYGCLGAVVWAETVTRYRRNGMLGRRQWKSWFALVGMPLIGAVGFGLGLRVDGHGAGTAALCGAAQLALWLIVPGALMYLAYWEAERAEAQR